MPRRDQRRADVVAACRDARRNGERRALFRRRGTCCAVDARTMLRGVQKMVRRSTRVTRRCRSPLRYARQRRFVYADARCHVTARRYTPVVYAAPAAICDTTDVISFFFSRRHTPFS
jgi:hypothetical protein